MAGLLELSNNHGNLSNDLRIAIPELISPMYSAGVGVNYQAVVLPAAAPAQVGPISLEDDIQRLLPHRFRPAIVWLFLLAALEHGRALEPENDTQYILAAKPIGTLFLLDRSCLQLLLAAQRDLLGMVATRVPACAARK